MGTGPRWDLAVAACVASSVSKRLAPFCERIECAGSIRRGKADVGDVELVYVPRVRCLSDGLFGDEAHLINEANVEIARLVDEGWLRPRLNKRGGTAWGAKNKLAVDVISGIPVDLFETTPEAWFNYLVCRTGPAKVNIEIAARAKERGWQWNPYGPGFSRLADGQQAAMGSERAVFEFVGLPYLEPPERGSG